MGIGKNEYGQTYGKHTISEVGHIVDPFLLLSLSLELLLLSLSLELLLSSFSLELLLLCFLFEDVHW